MQSPCFTPIQERLHILRPPLDLLVLLRHLLLPVRLEVVEADLVLEAACELLVDDFGAVLARRAGLGLALLGGAALRLLACGGAALRLLACGGAALGGGRHRAGRRAGHLIEENEWSR